MARYDSRLITPPSEEEEIYPYRRVWPSIALENGALFAVAIALHTLTRFASLASQLYQPINVLIALLPLGLWAAFSWQRERYVLEPRQNLLAVVIVTGLVANAISLPVIDDVFQVHRWLPLESALNRIAGYTFTVGLTQAVTVYLTMRYTIWPGRLRSRLDGVAYGAASAVGYATILNLRSALTIPAEPGIAAIYVFDHTAMLLCNGIIIGYGLAEVAFNRRPFPPLLASTVALSACVTGLTIPLVSGFANTSLNPLNPVSTTNPLLGLLFSAGLLFAVSNTFSFLFRVAERQEVEVRPEEAENLEV